LLAPCAAPLLAIGLLSGANAATSAPNPAIPLIERAVIEMRTDPEASRR